MARIRELNPGWRISEVEERFSYPRAEDTASVIEGLRRPG